MNRKPMILLIDNYDSFVHVLARYFRELGCETRVARNSEITVSEITELRPQAIVISPGPGTPELAGVSVEVIRGSPSQIPLLGVCLGHQAIAVALGASVVRSGKPVHGMASDVVHAGEGLFHGIENPLTATRYHSLIVEESSLPRELRVIARTGDGTIMGLQHTERPVFGVQFHPESVLSHDGHKLLANFLRIAGVDVNAQPGGDLLGASVDPDNVPPGLTVHW